MKDQSQNQSVNMLEKLPKIIAIGLTGVLVLTVPSAAFAVDYTVQGGIVTFYGGASSADYSVSTSGQGGGVPPAISSVAKTDTTESTIKITWTTDIKTDSFVEYGKTTSYGSSQGVFDSVTSHAVSLVGLEYSTEYHYRVCSRNTASVKKCSSDGTFTTSKRGTSAKGSAAISGVGSTVATGLVTVAWTTDKEADSFVDYGLTATYTNAQGVVESKTSHKVKLVGLVPGTTYHYRVRSTDASGKTSYSDDQTFATASSAVSGISAVTISDVGLTSALVTWSTGSVATSVIHYGTTPDYGSKVVDESESKTTQHTLRMPGLASGTLYHFRIAGVDASGESFTSDDYVFSTIKLPEIKDIEATTSNDGKVKVRWKTNVDADSIVVYGETTEYGLSTGSGDLTTDHIVTISGLTGDSTYRFKATSRDSLGNRAESADLTFTTPKDEAAPVISEVLNETSSQGSGGAAKIQLIISWTTDEPATSQVEYGEGIGGGGEYSLRTTEDESLLQSHLVIVSGLSPSTTYRFRLVSKDKAGNVGMSDEYTVVTPVQEQSALQIIVVSLEDTFGWLIKLKDLNFGLPFRIF